MDTHDDSSASGGLENLTNGSGGLVNITSEHINFIARFLAAELSGDVITAPQVVTLSAPGGQGTVYFTFDRSDPRLAGGAVSPAALAYAEPIIVTEDTFSVVKRVVPEGKTTCGLCSRLRRGSLYGFARSIGASKIALGHHRDDIVETLHAPADPRFDRAQRLSQLLSNLHLRQFGEVGQFHDFLFN